MTKLTILDPRAEVGVGITPDNLLIDVARPALRDRSACLTCPACDCLIRSLERAARGFLLLRKRHHLTSYRHGEVSMTSPLELRSAQIEAQSEDELRETLYRMKATDGLPVILPTLERVEKMLSAAAIAGYDRSLVLGEVGPNMWQTTVEKVAANAVMAGCLPDHFPVVMSAMMALCDPRMDAFEFQVTTHHTTPLLIVKWTCGKGSQDRVRFWCAGIWPSRQSVYRSCRSIAFDQSGRRVARGLCHVAPQSPGLDCLLPGRGRGRQSASATTYDDGF